VKPHSLALLVFLLATTACAHADAGPEEVAAPGGAASRAERVDTRRTADALSLLRELDHRRSLAWADGDAAALAELYTRASRTGRHDRAMLAAYAARGLRVSGLRTQVLTALLRSWSAGRVTLEVTDRVVCAHAVGRGVRITLPRDRPSTRVVSLRRVGGAWLVDEVTDAVPQRRPGPPSGPGTGSPPPPVPPGAG
jgi:hypothetical protein